MDIILLWENDVQIVRRPDQRRWLGSRSSGQAMIGIPPIVSLPPPVRIHRAGPINHVKSTDMTSHARFYLVGVDSVREIPEHEARRLADFGSTYCLVRDGYCPHPVGLTPARIPAAFRHSWDARALARAATST